MEEFQDDSNLPPQKPLLGQPGKLMEQLEGRADIVELSKQFDEA
jgi:hypothetical protein